MAFIKKYSIEAPNDPEVNIKVRDALEYYMCFPEGYTEKEKYGLVFCIAGYGDTADSEYYSNKLCTYISDKHNVITVGVRYHNDARLKAEIRINIPSICRVYDVNEDYFYNDKNKALIDRLLDLMVERRISTLDPRVALSTEAYHRYSSFGFMPAIDHLFVLSDILKKYNIDRYNIIAFGTSYGGYVASLMAKYAPQTFSLVIDNSGFCVAQLQEILGSKLGGMSGASVHYINDKRYEIPINSETLWSLDETSDLYFSDAHKKIRNLMIEEHRTKSETIYCCYHSIKDDIAPIKLKDNMYEILSKYNQTYYKRIEGNDIDGKLFKTTEHGMKASLRSMFDCSMEKYRELGCKCNGDTDFDLGATNKFVCLDRQYNFSFSDRGLDVTIDKLKVDCCQFMVESKHSAKPVVDSEDNNRNNVLYINNIKRNTEVARYIMDLIPTMKEGLEFILQNSGTSNLKAGMNVAEDFAYCINSIEDAVKSMDKTLPPNQLEYKIKKMREAIKLLLELYKADQRENIIEIIGSEVVPLFGELEEELIRVL